MILKRKRAVANFLDRETGRIDNLILKRETFLGLIAEQKSATIEQLINGVLLKTRSGGHKDWFGQLPPDWSALRAKFIFRERQDRSQGGDEELLTVSHITGVTRRSEKDVNMFLAESMEGYKLVSKGDVVINTMWAWMGAMGVSSVDGLISPSYGVYSQISNRFESGYLDLLLRSRTFIAEVTRRSKGIHSSRLRLYPDAFLDMLLPFPSREAQGAVLSALKTVTRKEDNLTALNRRSLNLLREFRSSLVAAAVNAQIDVKNWSKHRVIGARAETILAETVS